MKMKIKSNNFIYPMLFIMIISMQSEFAKYTFFLTLITFIFLLFKKYKLFISTYKNLKYLLSIVFIGFMVGLLEIVDKNLYFFGKDIYFFLQPLLYILFGIYLFAVTKDIDKILKTIVYATFVITLFKIGELLIDSSILFNIFYGTSAYASLINYSAVVGIAIILYSKKMKIRLFSKYFGYMVLSVYFVSVILSFSRTTYIAFLIVLLIPFLVRKRLLVKLYWIIVVFIFFIIFGGQLVSDNSTSIDSFSDKVKHSLSEISIKNYTTASGINENWRGYEAYLGLSQYYKGNVVELVFGQGFGTVVVTPFWIFKGEKLDIIPRFHNGYITILLKTGIMGLILFFLFFYSILKFSIKHYHYGKSSYSRYTSLLLQMTVFIVLFFTLVIHGIFTTEPQIVVLVLIGVLLKNIDDTKKIQRSFR